MDCRCGRPYVLASCPDKRPGCLVAHYRCPVCAPKRAQDALNAEGMAAMLEAQGAPVLSTDDSVEFRAREVVPIIIRGPA